MKALEDYAISNFMPQEPVSDPQLSPDGSLIAFTYTQVNYEEDRYDSSIWVKETGEEGKRLTYGNGDSSPRCFPDSTQIAFLSNRSPVEGAKGKQLWLIPVGGGEARRLTELPWGVRTPVWGPNGDAVYFHSEDDAGEKAEGSDVKIVRRINYKYDPGRGVYAGRRIHLFKVDLDGKVEQLTEGEYDVRDYAVHPGGESVEFISNRDEYADLTWFRYIYSLNLETKDLSTLFNGEDNGVGNMSRLGWSPDGSRLAFTGRPMESMDYVEYRNQELYVLDGEKNLSNLTSALDRRIGVSPVIQWSGDSNWVYFTKPEAGSRHLCRANRDGVIETLVDGELNVAGFSVGESSIALNYTDMKHPSELYTLKEGALSKETRMSSVPEGFVAPEEFWFTASDGVEIQGWIVKPRDVKAGKKYPAILQIHGGPRVHFGYMYQGIEHEFQVLSEHGFAVVFTNPRGSIG